MKLYFKYDFVWEELINNFIKYFNVILVDNILLADIIIFNNFTLEDRKFLLKNKQLWNTKKFFCYIHEPLIDHNDANYNLKMIRRLQYFDFINIITYSKTNLQYILKKKLFPHRKHFYLPINYFKSNDFSPQIIQNKNINGLILHRNAIHKNKDNHNSNVFPLKLIEKNNLTLLNHWGKERDNMFLRTKIFINLHKKSKVNFLETLRIHNLIYNRVIIISEPCFNNDDDLSKYVIFSDNLEKTYNLVLNNYEHYFNKIYGDKNNKQIFQNINNYYLEFNNFIS